MEHSTKQTERKQKKEMSLVKLKDGRTFFPRAKLRQKDTKSTQYEFTDDMKVIWEE